MCTLFHWFNDLKSPILGDLLRGSQLLSGAFSDHGKMSEHIMHPQFQRNIIKKKSILKLLFVRIPYFENTSKSISCCLHPMVYSMKYPWNMGILSQPSWNLPSSKSETPSGKVPSSRREWIPPPLRLEIRRQRAAGRFFVSRTTTKRHGEKTR